MKFCQADNCSNPVFGKGFCRNHQYKREDYDRRSILQRGIDKHKEEQKRKPTKAGWFNVQNAFSDQIGPSKPKTIHSPHEIEIGEERDGSVIIDGNLVDMDSFWRYAEGVIAKTGSKCWECSDIISKSDYRNSTGHIFPKSIFLSVAANPWNFVVVGCRCGCHHKTHTLATFSQMSIFPTAVNRYTKFGHLITENHKYLDLFLDYANAII